MAHDRRLHCFVLTACFCLTFVQTTSVQAPTFEAASVKRSVPGTTGGRVQFLPGRFVGENVPLDYLLQQVYGVRNFQIIAAPEWRAIIADGRDSRYQIQAKANDTATPEQVKEMVKTLLAERFGLRVHKEMRDLPVYALVQARGGVKGAREATGPRAGFRWWQTDGYVDEQRRSRCSSRCCRALSIVPSSIEPM